MNRGFTLIELVIVTVVIGILAAIAIPSYTAYIVRANRSDARGQVLMAAQWMERFRTQNGTYAGAALPAALKQSPAKGTKKYDIALVSDATSFSLTATPTGSMSGDQCGALTIDHTGALGQGGSTKEICWDR